MTVPHPLVRTLARPRWIALILVVAILVVVFLELSQWQLRRLDERRAQNAIIEANEDAPPVPAADLLEPGRRVPADREWQPVTATGTYDTEHELLVRYRHFRDRPGFHVLTPLVTQTGTAVLVNRGWIPQGRSATDLPTPPDPPTGEVTVTGRTRRSEHVDPDQVRVHTGQIRYIDVPIIAGALDYPVFGGYVELVEQQPPTDASSPQRLPPPELDTGPHLSYAIQWVIFAVIAVGGVGFLLYDTLKGGRARDRLREREYRGRSP